MKLNKNSFCQRLRLNIPKQRRRNRASWALWVLDCEQPHHDCCEPRHDQTHAATCQEWWWGSARSRRPCMRPHKRTGGRWTRSPLCPDKCLQYWGQYFIWGRNWVLSSTISGNSNHLSICKVWFAIFFNSCWRKLKAPSTLRYFIIHREINRKPVNAQFLEHNQKHWCRVSMLDSSKENLIRVLRVLYREVEPFLASKFIYKNWKLVHYTGWIPIFSRYNALS